MRSIEARRQLLNTGVDINANNFWTTHATEKICTVLESWKLQLSKTVHSFSVMYLVQKLLPHKVDSGKLTLLQKWRHFKSSITFLDLSKRFQFLHFSSLSKNNCLYAWAFFFIQPPFSQTVFCLHRTKNCGNSAPFSCFLSCPCYSARL